MATQEFLVDARWFQEHRDDSSTVIVDARPAKDYWAGHLASARHFDPFPFPFYDTSDHGLQVFRKQMEWIFTTLGVAGKQSVVFYEDDSGMRATRAAWVLEYIGHPTARVLDGGLKSLGGGEKLVTEAPAVRPVALRESEQPGIVASLGYTRDHLNTRGVQIFDVRTPEEYYGENVRARHGGAIPGAIHQEWIHFKNPAGAFQSPAELRERFTKLGLNPEAEIITYCQGGYRAAHTYFALKLAGFPRVRNYMGSWAEWGNHDDVPVDHPKRPA
jgi:thiosulfate/3-mercaptopyruvate sulfurtransferase